MKMRIGLLAVMLVFHGIHAAAQGRGFCAVPAHESDPQKPKFHAFCKGTIWSDAKQGECVQLNKPDTCRSGSTTNVDIHQYKMAWNAETNVCDLTPTGVTDTVKGVPNVMGTTCNVW
jgi:hypothetical protein